MHSQYLDSAIAFTHLLIFQTHW